jgi:hypothetical protein
MIPFVAPAPVTALPKVPAIDTPEEFARDIKTGRAGAEQVVKESGLPPQ